MFANCDELHFKWTSRSAVCTFLHKYSQKLRVKTVSNLKRYRCMDLLTGRIRVV